MRHLRLNYLTMKKYLIYLFLLLAVEANACDICGCANGGSFFGLLPQQHQQFMGIKFRQNSYNSHIGSQLLESVETFQAAEIWGRFYPMKRTQLLVFVPFQKNVQNRNYDGFQSKLEGIGDASLLLHYNLLNTFTDTTKTHNTWNHQVMIGGGLKLPTGQSDFNQYDVSEVANANFQLGTGSWDVPLNLIYTIKKHDYGLNVNMLYKVNTNNQNDYKFANQAVLSLMVFRSVYVGNSQLMPSVGLYADYKKQDLKEGVRNKFTGGYSTAALTSLDFFTGKFGFNAAARVPIVQNLSGGDLKINSTMSFGISRVF
jgi:hypothetical protein